MSKITPRYAVTVTATMTLTEDEMGALDALAGYGTEAFLKVYEHLGKSYLRPHEAGLRSLFANIRDATGQPLADARTARELLHMKRHPPEGQVLRMVEAVPAVKGRRPWWRWY